MSAAALTKDPPDDFGQPLPLEPLDPVNGTTVKLGEIAARAARGLDFTESELEFLVSRAKAFKKAEGISQNELATRLQVPGSTLSQILSSKYQGDLQAVMRQFAIKLHNTVEREELRRRVDLSDVFVETPTALQMQNIFRYAHLLSNMAVIVGPPGRSKTSAAKNYLSTKPGVFLVTASPEGRYAAGILSEVAAAINITTQGTARSKRVVICQRMSEGMLIIIDEAQHLEACALESLRHIHDQTGCGIVMMGNSHIVTKMNGMAARAQFAQLTSRLGMQLSLPKSLPKADVECLLDTYGIEGADERALLHNAAKKHGALRRVNKIVTLARYQHRESRPFIDSLRAAESMLSLS